MFNNKLKKNRFKPVLKQLLQTKLTAIVYLKVLKAKRKKWLNYINFLKNGLVKTKYKKYKIIDQKKVLLQKKNRFELNYGKTFKKTFLFSKIFNIFFNKIKKSYCNKIKNFIKKNLTVSNTKVFLMKKLESRLDYVLFRSKLYPTLRSAKNGISQGYVFVNKKPVKDNSFLLKSGDIINLSKKAKKKIKKNLVSAQKWPIIPNFLLVNYKTTEILFIGTFLNQNNFIFFYPFFFNLPNRLKTIMKNGPKNLKFKKIKKGKLKKAELKTNKIKFGVVGLKAIESGTISFKQIESSKQIITKKTKRKSKLWVKIFPYTPVTAKPLSVRMGKGKGKISHWSACVKTGSVIFELSGKNRKMLISSLELCRFKLPIKTKICYKNNFG